MRDHDSKVKEKHIDTGWMGSKLCPFQDPIKHGLWIRQLAWYQRSGSDGSHEVGARFALFSKATVQLSYRDIYFFELLAAFGNQ